MVELPTEEIWRFKLSENNKIDLSKFKVHFEGNRRMGPHRIPYSDS